MYKRGQVRAFPLFFSYLTAVLVNNLIRIAVGFCCPGNSSPYFYTYWGTDIVNVGLSFAVLYEVLDSVLTSGTIKVSRSTFLLLISILALTSAVLAYFTKTSVDFPLIHGILLAEGTVRFAQIGVLLVFLGLTLFFGFYWGDQAFGISAGFGFFAAVMVVNTAIRQLSGQADNRRFALTNVGAYVISSLIWLFYALKTPKSPPPTLPPDEVSKYTDSIKKIIK